MGENPEYWTAIATVVPVLALTLATVYRNNRWHRRSTFDRRLSAIHGITVVISLAYVEHFALAQLQAKTSSDLAERLSLAAVSFIAFQVIALPILPLGLIALHDLHPQVRKAKKFPSVFSRKSSDCSRSVIEVKCRVWSRRSWKCT